MSDETTGAEPTKRRAGRRPTPIGEEQDDLFAVRVIVTPEQAHELIGRTDLDFGDRPHIRSNPDGTSSLELFASRSAIEDLQAKGHQVEVGENVSAVGRERQAEVSTGDRFQGGRIAPRGIGRKFGGRGPSGDSGPEGSS